MPAINASARSCLRSLSLSLSFWSALSSTGSSCSLTQLGPLITAFATAVIAWYTWALRNSTNRLWEAGQTFNLNWKGRSSIPTFDSRRYRGWRLKLLSFYDHPTSPVTPRSLRSQVQISETLAEAPRCSKSVAAQMDHWTEMVEEPRVDFLKRYDVEPVIEPGEQTEQVFTGRVTIPIDKAAFESLKGRQQSSLPLSGRSLFLTSSARTTSRPSASLTTSAPSDLSDGRAAITGAPV